MKYTMTSLNDELKKEYKTTLEMHKDCQCLNIQIKKNIKIRKEITGTSIHSLKDMEEAARKNHELGPRYVLL